MFTTFAVGAVGIQDKGFKLRIENRSRVDED